MAGKFRTAAYAFIEELDELAGAHGRRIKRTTTGETEGGAGTVSMTFVLALDGDDALTGTPMAVNGSRAPGKPGAQMDLVDEVERGFEAARAHRPGAEAEDCMG